MTIRSHSFLAQEHKTTCSYVKKKHTYMHMFLLLNNLNTMFVGLVDANVCWFTIWLFNVVNWTTTICTARCIYIYIYVLFRCAMASMASG